MKKILLVAVASLFVSKMLLAQDVKSEIIANKNLSASNYLAYPMPQNTKERQRQKVINLVILVIMAATAHAF